MISRETKKEIRFGAKYNTVYAVSFIFKFNFLDTTSLGDAQGVFGWGEWRSEIGIGMDDSHSNHLVGRSLILISIPGRNKNGSIYIEFNLYSPLWIQIFIPISIPITNQTFWRIWSFRFRFRFQAIPISIPISISITNQTPPYCHEG